MLSWFCLVASTAMTVWIILGFPIPHHLPQLPDPPRWLETYTQERRRCHRQCLASIAQLERELNLSSDPLGEFTGFEFALPESTQTTTGPSLGTSQWARAGEIGWYEGYRKALKDNLPPGPMGKYS